MASHSEIARFFQLALRVGLATTADVERWIDVVLRTETVIAPPIAELAAAHRLPRANVDERLGEVTGAVREFLPAHLVLALVARRLEMNAISPGDAASIGRAIGNVGEIPEHEYRDLDGFDDEFQLAARGTYGDVDAVGRDVRAYFARYDAYAADLPATI